MTSTTQFLRFLRRATVVLPILLCGLVAGCGGSASARAQPNPIPIENAKQGTADWRLAGGFIGGQTAHIEGYASEISVKPGDILRMHVNTAPTARYRIEIYRLGWYHGLGGRLVACLPSSCAKSEPGAQHPMASADPSTGELDAGWPVTDSIAVNPSWTTGYYVAKLVLTGGRFSGHGSYIYFIVRAPPGSTAPILVQASVNTWEAYNNWGGKSLYAFNSTGARPAVEVSFNRPFGRNGDAGQSPWTWEIPLVRFLERNGYDVAYQTDVDTDQNPSSLLGHKLDIVSGHDEYWSKAIREAFDRARVGGVNLAFIGADIGSWQIRYADSDRALFEYRSVTADPDPSVDEKTTRFADLGRPECELLGVQFHGQEGSADQTYTVEPAAASNPWFAHTGLVTGDTLPHTVGYEFDSIQPGCRVPRLQDLMHWQGSPSADAVAYVAPSGARVFSDGTLSLTWSLNAYNGPGGGDPRVQALFRHIFDSLEAIRR